MPPATTINAMGATIVTTPAAPPPHPGAVDPATEVPASPAATRERMRSATPVEGAGSAAPLIELDSSSSSDMSATVILLPQLRRQRFSRPEQLGLDGARAHAQALRDGLHG